MNKKNQTSSALLLSVVTSAAVVIVLFAVCVLIFSGKLQFVNKDKASDSVMQQTVAENIAPQVPPAKENASSLAEDSSQSQSQEQNMQQHDQTDYEPMVMYVANVENSIYLRSAPEEDSSNIITTIPFGSAVAFVENANAVFAYITYDGQDGYVKREYLSTKVPQKKTTYEDNTVKDYLYVTNVKNSIYLRSSASEDSNNIIATIPVGTKVGFIKNANNVFAKINYNGTIGYAKSQYLGNYYYGSSNYYMTVSNVKNSIYLRSTPAELSDNIICEIPVNSVVSFIDRYDGVFYRISWNGYTGYAKAKYLE